MVVELKFAGRISILGSVLAVLFGGAPAHASTSTLSMQAPLTGFRTVVGTEFSQGFDEYSKTLNSSFLQSSYAVSDATSIEAVLAYSYRMSRLESDDDKNFSLEDSELSANYKFDSAWLNERDLSFRVGSGAVLPTSEASQKATMYGAWTAKAVLQKRLQSLPVSFYFNNKLYYNFHRFETADVYGTAYNSQFDFVQRLGAAYQFNQKFGVNVEASLISSSLYSGRIQYTQGYSVELDYQVASQSTVYLSGKTKDRIVSNNSLLDDDNSKFGIGVTHLF